MLSRSLFAPTKVDSHLREMLRVEECVSIDATQRGLAWAPDEHEPIAKQFGGLVQFDGNGRPIVQISSYVNPVDLLPALEALDADVFAISQAYKRIDASVDITAIRTVAELPGVRFLNSAYRPIAMAGGAMTQGDAVIKADEVRAEGYDGSPTLIGFMSDSALDIDRSQSSQDLPSQVDRYLELWASDEGRAMMEIAYDIAPGARMAHHSVFPTELSFAEGIRTLANAGSRIIVDDYVYPQEPFFQDGLIAQSVKEVTQQSGVLYISAAGNESDLSYESRFSMGDQEHDFDPGDNMDTRQTISVPGVPAGYFAPMKLILQWDQPFYTADGVTSDFDLSIYDASGQTVIVAADTDNIASLQPVEVVQWESTASEATEFTVGIRLKAGSSSALLKYILFGPNGTTINEFATHSPTIVGHAASADAIAVGAVPYFSPAEIEPFSSIGDSVIYFDNEGNRLVTPEVRSKPDLVAPDNVNTTFFGTDISDDDDSDPNFSGTSAAAPHVAGVAALILDANPHLTRDELYSVLTSTAVDLGDPGRDTVFGWGLVDAAEGLSAALRQPDVTVPTATLVSPISKHGWSVKELEIVFSEPVVATVAATAANYTLTEAGADHVHSTSDDVTYTVSATYENDRRMTTLAIVAPAPTLELGSYRIKAAAAISDSNGNELGAGVGFSDDFTIETMSETVVIPQMNEYPGPYDTPPQLTLRPDGTAIVAYTNHPVLQYLWPQIMIAEFTPQGHQVTPFRTIPTQMKNASKVLSLDVAVTDSNGVVVYATDERTFYYQLLGSDARESGQLNVAGYSYYLDIGTDMNPAGDFAVAYASGGSLSDTKIVGRVFDMSGNPKTSVFDVSVSDHASAPIIRIASDGTMTVVWAYQRIIGLPQAFARRFDSSGNPISEEFPLSTMSNGFQFSADLAVSDDGHFAAVWYAGAEEGVGGVWLQLFDPAGNRVGMEVPIDPHGQNPQIAMTPDGRFAVSWSAVVDGEARLFAQKFLANGSAMGQPIWVNDEGPFGVTYPTLDVNEEGDIVVLWRTGSLGGALRWIRWDVASDNVPPALASIVRYLPLSSATNADVLRFQIAFDEDVVAVDSTDFMIDGASTASVTNVEQVVPASYIVTITGGDLAQFNGSVGLNLSASFNITDLAGNMLQNGDPSMDEEYLLDNTVPEVMVTDLVSNNNEPIVGGTVTDASPSSGVTGVTVVVGGQTLAATVFGTTWSVEVPAALADGLYDVQATAVDVAGNSSSDGSVDELRIDTAPPVLEVLSFTFETGQPTLGGTVMDASPSSGVTEVAVIVEGTTYTAIVTGNSWTTEIPLVQAGQSYVLSVTATDAAGNQSSVELIVPAWMNSNNPLDANHDLFVTPLDALVVINMLNVPTILDADGRLPLERPTGSNYYDVNGDEFCTPNDVLLIINWLIRQEGEGESGPEFGDPGHSWSHDLPVDIVDGSGLSELGQSERVETLGAFLIVRQLVAISQVPDRRGGRPFVDATRNVDDWEELDRAIDDIASDVWDAMWREA